MMIFADTETVIEFAGYFCIFGLLFIFYSGGKNGYFLLER